MIEVGKTYYLIVHAYHNYIGTVTEVTPRSVTVHRCIKVHSCGRPWTKFFEDGCGTDTNFDDVPDGTILFDPIAVHPWEHDVPTKRKKLR